MTGAWGLHAATDLRAVEDPTGRTLGVAWGRPLMVRGRDPNDRTLEAAWGRPPMLRGRVRDDDPTVGSWGGCSAVEELVGANPTGETLEAVSGPTGCLLSAPPW